MQGVFLLCFCFWPLWAMEKVQIAVLDLTGESPDVRQEVRTISDRLESELIKTGAFRLLERRRIHGILQEQGFQESGECHESSCQVQMGQFWESTKLWWVRWAKWVQCIP